MSQLLEIPDQLFEALNRAAQATGTTPLGWISAHLPPQEMVRATAPQKTMYDVLKDRIGLVTDDLDETLSEACGEKFTDHLEEKSRRGHL